MHGIRTIEATALVLALVLVLFTPMLDPIVSFGAAVVLVAVLLAVTSWRGTGPGVRH